MLQLMMKTLKTIFNWFTVVFVLIGVILGMILGWYIFTPKTMPTPAITSKSIVDSIVSKGTLITQTVFINQTASTKVDKGSDWSNFWWGYEVDSQAEMRADIGIDLSKLGNQDVIVNQANKTVCIKYPKAEIVNVTDIQVETKSGILKQILDSNTNKDYNLALSQLKDSATSAINEKPELFSDATVSADRTISFLLNNTGYTVTQECRQ
jgi:hypothetical protein